MVTIPHGNEEVGRLFDPDDPIWPSPATLKGSSRNELDLSKEIVRAARKQLDLPHSGADQPFEPLLLPEKHDNIDRQL